MAPSEPAFELDPTSWMRAAAAVEAVIAALPEPASLPVPDDRYGAVLTAIAKRSDDLTRDLHSNVVEQLHAVADQIRANCVTVVDTDHAGAQQISSAQ